MTSTIFLIAAILFLALVALLLHRGMRKVDRDMEKRKYQRVLTSPDSDVLVRAPPEGSFWDRLDEEFGGIDITPSPALKKTLFVVAIVLVAAYISLVVSVDTQQYGMYQDNNAGRVATEDPITGAHYDLKTVEYVSTMGEQQILTVVPLDYIDVRFDSSINKSIMVEHVNVWGGVVRREAILGQDIFLLQKR